MQRTTARTSAHDSLVNAPNKAVECKAEKSRTCPQRICDRASALANLLPLDCCSAQRTTWSGVGRLTLEGPGCRRGDVRSQPRWLHHDERDQLSPLLTVSGRLHGVCDDRNSHPSYAVRETAED